MGDALLEVRRLTKRFGGLLATSAVDLDILAGETHAVIGPNGAGKTTLIAQLSGDLRPDAGTIRFRGEEITWLPCPARSQRGLARSFQVTSIFKDLTALANVALSVQAHAGHSFRFWRPARRERALVTRRSRRSDQWGLRAGRHAGRPPLVRRAAPARDRHGAGHRPPDAAPRRAGGGHGSGGVAAHDGRSAPLSAGQTLLLVEHDMDVVFALADRISVMVSGRILATGLPAEIRANAEVRRAYLGEEARPDARG